MHGTQGASELTGSPCGTECNRRNSRSYADAVARHLNTSGNRYDCLFSPNTWLFADLDHPMSKIACVDILIDEYIRTYFADRRVDPFYVVEANSKEREALAKQGLLIVPSQSTERNARDFYGMAANRVVRIAFGGSPGIAIVPGNLATTIDRRMAQDRLEFLFVGKEWGRKNGQLVVRTCQAISDSGVPVHAHFVGVERSANFPAASDRLSTFYGFVDLRAKAGIDHVQAIAARCSFFFLPSRAEAFGLSFAEACSHGLTTYRWPCGRCSRPHPPGNRYARRPRCRSRAPGAASPRAGG
ncbi:MAG: hypothetical protein ABIT16_09145 [Croceibacterium sp.]